MMIGLKSRISTGNFFMMKKILEWKRSMLPKKKHLEAINSDVEIIALNNVTSLYVIQGNVVVENLTFP